MGPFCARKGMPRIQVRLVLCSSPTIAGVIVELSGVVVWIASTAVKAQHEGRRTVLATNVDRKRKRPARKHSNQVSNALCTAVKQELEVEFVWCCPEHAARSPWTHTLVRAEAASPRPRLMEHSSCRPPVFCIASLLRDTWLLSQAQPVALALRPSAAAVSLSTSTAQPPSFRLALHLPPSSASVLRRRSTLLLGGRRDSISLFKSRSLGSLVFRASKGPSASLIHLAVLKYRLDSAPVVELFSNTPSLTLRPTRVFLTPWCSPSQTTCDRP